jgi:hypothetical protein
MSAPVFNQAPTVMNRPFGRLDAQGRVIPDSFADEAFQGEYSGTNLIYKGFARPGASTSAAVWQIAFLTYDGSNNLLSIQWPQDANGHASNDYQFIWANRASYTYS